MALFQTSVLKTFLTQLDKSAVERAYKKYTTYFHNATIQENIKNSKEEQYQAKFLDELFVNVLDYTLNPKPNFNITTEFKSQTGAGKADGAILKGNSAIGVIELKGTNTKDLESIRKQAFDYKANQKGCVYVITSNFEKLRFYINDATEFLEFNLFQLATEEFALLYLCLHKDNILNHLPLTIKEASLVEEDKITKQFYNDYSVFKRELFRDLVKRNAKRIKIDPAIASEAGQSHDDSNTNENKALEKNVKLSLFKKSQKLIDRFLFIFFAEDRDLLPPNSTIQILDKWKADNDFGDERPLYNLFKQYFHFLDEGRPRTTSRAEIYGYNGGLFKPDVILDNLEIDNDLLYKHTYKLAKYDFSSQVDVNILGHIFENSLNEIESVNAEIEGGEFDKQKSKRKKDGVFYTPKYITKYIVEHTVGKLCQEKKDTLGFKEEAYFEVKKGTHQNTKMQLLEVLDTYRNWLLQITICDPACGSGAFLNQALDFLIKEHRYLDELKAKVTGGSLILSDIENTILENNIYGVDLNEESVEIAKLSLWLRTAQPRRKLNDLSNNIKCGNSLIDDKKVAGDKAFHWETEFPHLFKEKDKKAYHITTAVHDSRTSARMETYKVRERRAMGTNPYPNVHYFTEDDNLVITQTLATIVQEDGLQLLAYNICGDHIHLLLVCDLDEVPGIMQKIKSVTSKMVNRARDYTRERAPLSEGRDITREHAPLQSGHAPLSEGEDITREHAPLQYKHAPLQYKHTPLWQQKYSAPKEITSTEQLHNTLKYIQSNRQKHKLPPHSKALQDIIDTMCCNVEDAFKPTYLGGFDVVIGNPPYVRAELLTDYLGYFEKNYNVYHSASDLFAYFYELGSKIINKKGIMGYISNTFDKTTAGKVLRDYLASRTNLKQYIDFTEVKIFEGATTYPIIIILQNYNDGSSKFKYVKIPKSSQNRVIDIDVEDSIEVLQDTLDSNSWSFSSVEKAKILNKISQFPSLRKVYGKCYRGLITGLNEAFIIDNNWASSEHIKPIFEGKEIKKWTVQKAEQKLILFKSKWTDSAYPEKSTEEEKLYALVRDFPEILSHLLPYKESAVKRYDKGDYWWELRNCAYYDLFDKPKIIFPNLQNTNKFCFDAEGTFVNAPAVFLPIDSKALLCILNSKVVWEFLKSICVVRSGGYIEVKPQYFEQIPIPEIKSEVEFEDKANSVIGFVNDLQHLDARFQNYISSRFAIDKLTRKLENWRALDFSAFIKELNKAIKTAGGTALTKKDEFEWLELFEENKKKAQALQAQIAQTEKEIDEMVYELYGLTEEEIAIVERGITREHAPL